MKKTFTFRYWNYKKLPDIQHTAYVYAYYGIMHIDDNVCVNI